MKSSLHITNADHNFIKLQKEVFQRCLKSKKSQALLTKVDCSSVEIYNIATQPYYY